MALTQRSIVNFVGAGVTVTDDGTRSVVTIPGGGGHTIQDEGTPLTARTGLNFAGAGVTATDDAGNNRTLITIPGVSSSGGATSMTAAAFDAETANGTTNPSARNLVFFTDGAHQAIWNGSAWEFYHGPFKTIRPLLSQFAWVAQLGATATQRSGLVFATPYTGGLQLHLLKKAAPTPPYSVVIAFLPSLFANNNNEAGVIWRQSSDGKLVTVRWIAGSNNIGISKWDSPTSHNSLYTTTSLDRYQMEMFRSLVWMRLEDDATNRKVYFAPDGQNWTLVLTTLRTDFMTADEVGLFMRMDYTTGLTGYMNVISFG